MYYFIIFYIYRLQTQTIMAFMNTFKEGMAFTAGGAVIYIILMIAGLAFFIPGLLIVLNQMKKPKDKQNNGLKITGYILMGIGVVLGMGTGAYFLFGLIGADALNTE